MKFATMGWGAAVLVGLAVAPAPAKAQAGLGALIQQQRLLGEAEGVIGGMTGQIPANALVNPFVAQGFLQGLSDDQMLGVNGGFGVQPSFVGFAPQPVFVWRWNGFQWVLIRIR
jgi:hypothetical protein